MNNCMTGHSPGDYNLLQSLSLSSWTDFAALAFGPADDDDDHDNSQLF